MIVNQWVPAAHKGDAIGDSARRMRGTAARAWATQSEIYALTIDDDPAGRCASVRGSGGAAGRPHDLPLRAAVADDRGVRAAAARPRPPVPQRHAGVTSSRPTTRRCSGWRRSPARSSATLVGRVDLALGVSEFNRAELEALGFAPTGVLPLAVDLDAITQPRRAAGARARLLDDDFVNFLFVGRIAPNKKIEDHIRLAEHYKRYVDAYYRFIFVGRYDAVPRYYATIRALMSEYRLLNERFIFTGPVPDEDLAVYYRHAAVYISLSEHEGFCAPLLEAMAADVPVLAYSAAAVPETLGGAGVQFAPKDMEYAAELLGALAFDDDLRAQVIAGSGGGWPISATRGSSARCSRLVAHPGGGYAS